MRIRYTDPPRIEWEERVDGRWVGRTITVNHRNLERFGIASPGPDGEVATWHAKRLLAVLEREQNAGNAPKPILTVSGLIDAHLASLDCSPGMKE